MAVQRTSGAKLFIADPGPSSPEPTWVEVGEVTNYAEFGRVYNLITHDSIGTRGTRKFKGQYNEGTVTLQMGRDPQDAGQAKMIEARDSDDDYWFKIELNDATGSPATPTTFKFEALVMSYTTNVGDASTIVGATAQIEIQPDTVTETAAGA